MSSKRVCDKCGAALDATDGTCPACTMAAALDASTRRIQGAGFLDDLPVPAEPLIIADKYTVIKTIARGGMGIVYKARQENLNRIVAVKMLLSGFHASDELRQRFLREAKAAASLKHPNIVCIFDWGEDAGQPFFSMDYIEGQTLDALVRVRPLEPMAAATLMLTLAQAIQYAHQRGILHRDIKPSNIIVDGAGVPHITDFGLARQIHEATTLTASGEFLGTPGYLPPEQMSAKSGTVGPHSDVYGLGAVLFHLLTGQAPFQAATLLEMIQKVSDTEARRPSLLNPSVPRDLDTICLKCLSKDPMQRYATAEILARDLKAYVEHEKIQARPLSALERVKRWCRQKPLQAAAGLMLSLLVITAGTATFKWTQAVRQIRELETQAAAGDLRAQKVLGRVYEEGIGVKPDLDKAKVWAGLAAGQGDEESQARLDRLQGRAESATPTPPVKVADLEAARNPTPTQPMTPPRSPVTSPVIVINQERALPEAVAAASPQAAVSKGAEASNKSSTTVEVVAQVREVATPPATGRTVAIFVENRAGETFNKYVTFLEDRLAAQLGSANFMVISREDVMKAKKVYSTVAEFGTPRAIKNQTKSADPAVVGPGGIGVFRSDRSTTVVTVDKPEDQNLNSDRNSLGTFSDRQMSDGASAVRMAQLMGAEYVLMATIGSFGTSRATFDNPRLRLKGPTTTLVLRATYKVLDGYKGGAVAGGTAKAEKAVPESAAVQVESDDITKELIEDVSIQIVSAINVKSDSSPRPVGTAKVAITISSYAKDLAGNEISLPDVRLTERSVSRTEQNFPALVSASVVIDGVAMGTTPVKLQIFPGVHKLRLTRAGFETLDINFLAQEEATLTPSMWMNSSGFKRWMGVRTFLDTLDTLRQLPQEFVMITGVYAQTLRQNGYLVEIRKQTEEDLKGNTKEAPKTYLAKGLWDYWFSGL